MKVRIIGFTAALVGVTVFFASASNAQAQHSHGHHSHGHHDHGHHGWHRVAPIHDHGFHDDLHGDFYDASPGAPDDFFTSEPDADTEESPAAPTFGSFSQIEELAAQLETDVNQLCLDLHYNYSHNPGFQETYREAYAILRTIKFIHQSEHEGNRDAIVQSVQELDGLLHHVQGDIQEWSRHQRRQVGPGGVNRKLVVIESLFHHLMYDVGVEPQHDENEDLEGPPANGEAAPPPADHNPPAPGIGPRNSSPPTDDIETPDRSAAPQSPELEDGGPAFEDGGAVSSPPLETVPAP